ncbi:MAG: tetratricopeptide repeat protein, partial [Proteobacteria bacterium]|nr:tetratricopeptide repeat protein [Pseudomonadota bacterium]
DRLLLGQTARALARVDAALAAHADAPSLHDVRGRILLRTGDPAGARGAFERAIELDAEFGPALEGLAALTLEAGDTDVALALLDRASAADAGDGSAAYSAAQLELKRGNKQSAIERLRAVVAGNPAHALAANDLAWLLAEQGGEDELALDLARRAARIDRRPEILDTLGWVQHKRGEDAAAVATFREALGKAPDSPSIRYRLGVALAALERSEEARVELNRALAGGAFPEAEAARTVLAQLEEKP